MKDKFFDLLINIKEQFIRSIRPANERSNADVLNDYEEVVVIPDNLPLQFVPLKDNPDLRGLISQRAITVPPETRYFEVKNEGLSRKIAYTVSGDMNASNILICLPGLLETKESFLFLHAYFLKFESCKVISIDFVGRGQSDYIGDHQSYKMSLYLSDISEFIASKVLVEGNLSQKITILGTSMGGVLAMYLTKIFDKKIYEIILNDVALTVNWVSLYTLYKSMKKDLGYREVRELAKDLRVDEKAISDVQLPGHFDLSYRADVWGMNFHEALLGFKGRVGLIYGSLSKICTKQRVEDAKIYIPQLSTLEVGGAGHPVPFSFIVCDFIQQEMGI